MAVLRHPTLWDGFRSCWAADIGDICDDRRLYMHVLCGQGRTWKLGALKELKLWFLADMGGNQINIAEPYHEKLPCEGKGTQPWDVAWKQPLLSYYV